MAGVDSAGLGEVIHNLIPSFIESRSGNGTLDYIVDRAEVIQVFSLIHLNHFLVLMLV
jgi:actin-related protein 5